MKALSLTQPMAWAIFHGKDVENRTWRIGRASQHGPYSSYHRANFQVSLPCRIYIHASKKFNVDHWNWIIENDNRLVTNIPYPPFTQGAIIGEVDIIDCVENHGSRWFTGPYAFVLANSVEYDKPIPCRGMLGFFEPEFKKDE